MKTVIIQKKLGEPETIKGSTNFQIEKSDITKSVINDLSEINTLIEYDRLCVADKRELAKAYNTNNTVVLNGQILKFCQS